ncbi:hypothetical protein [Nocardia niigatensis]|uniref:hypothetical protein n=1 Tax=Nocardia niigatensis TaxID=209249 RepID=UPI0012F63228|nr:hypothetical protein [Nocardia niigatensis]
MDYQKRLREALVEVSRIYDLAIPQLAEKVASVRADLFLVRVDQAMPDGTIPLRQATALLESIDQMMRVSAMAAYNPQSTGRGRVPDVVSDFLNDDVRMGHTKKGSFIVTVAARIDDSDWRRGGSTTGAAATPDHRPSFTRQVMTKLAQSLETTRQFAADSDAFADVDDAIGQGLRLPMVQALQEIGGADGLRALDLSFEWAAAEPQRSLVPTRVTLDRAVIDVLPEIEMRLARKYEPERLTVVGPVLELKRADEIVEAAEGVQGEIVLRADVGGRSRRITVPLIGADYDWAVRAHLARLPFTATGELGKKGNAWRLNDPIEVDRSFLEFRLGG